jgi:hypothetical protein
VTKDEERKEGGMIDMVTRKRIEVEPDEGGGGCFEVPLDQLDAAVALLKANAIPHWPHEEALSMDDGPFMMMVELPRRVDPVVVQRLLDSVP